MPFANRQVKIGITTPNATGIAKALRALGDTDAPFIRSALTAGSKRLAGAVRPFAHASVAASYDFVGIKGSGADMRAVSQFKHPAAKSFEFGRKWYWAGYPGVRGRGSRKRGQRVLAPHGFKAEPFIGIVSGGKALEAVRPSIESDLLQSFIREFEAAAEQWSTLAEGRL